MASNNNTSPPLCAKGCGFFGNPATYNMCSKCYKDLLHFTEEKLKLLAIAEKPSNTTRTTVLPSNSAVDDNINSTSKTTTSSKKNRCQCCNKRVGLTGFKCRCGGLFCGMHRYPEEHACDFDFKTIGRVRLAEQNPLCNGDKLLERA